MKPISYNIATVVGRISAVAFLTIRHPIRFGIKLIPDTISEVGSGLADGWNSVDRIAVVPSRTERMEEVDPVPRHP